MKFKFKLLTLILLFFLFILTITSQNSTNIINKQKTFSNEFSKYNSYNPEFLNDYEENFTKTSSYIYSLNLVNCPNFLKLDDTKKAITINDIILINPKYYLDKNYVPTNLKEITTLSHIKRDGEIMYLEENCLNALTSLFLSAETLGLKLTIFSGYRPYTKQASLYENAKDKAYVAKPGHSEHQSGLAVDISTLDSGLITNFDKTDVFTFLENNAHKFGFILRYPKNKENITGYKYEPWHYRYVGTPLSTAIYNSSLTLEEYIYQNFEL